MVQSLGQYHIGSTQPLSDPADAASPVGVAVATVAPAYVEAVGAVEDAAVVEPVLDVPVLDVAALDEPALGVPLLGAGSRH